MWATAGSELNFGLLNLDNHVATLKTDGTANFNGGGAGSNTVDNMWATAGSEINFGLVNLGKKDHGPFRELRLYG
jgi:hypothetical protein